MANVTVVGAGARFASGLTQYTNRLADALAGSPGLRTSAVLMRQLLPTRLYPGRRRVGKPVTRVRYRPDVPVFDGVDWYWLPSMLRAARFLRRQRPRFVVLQWWTGTVLHSYVLLALIARRLGARVIVEFHEVLDPGEARLRFARVYVRRFMGLLLSRASGFVVHSQYDADRLRNAYPIGGRPLVKVPHGPYDHLQQTSQASSGPIAASPGVCNLLYFGVLRPYKGVEDLVRAFDALSPEEIEGYRLTIVGEPWEGYALPAEAVAASRYRDRITFVDRYVTDSEVAAYFAAADALVLPYRRCSSSGPLHIAMSHGLPVAVPAVGGLVEAATGYTGALLLPPGDVAALTDALRRLPGLAGRHHQDVRSWDETVAAYLRLFSEIDGRAAAPSVASPTDLTLASGPAAAAARKGAP
ncbi:glycosyltransferase [Streptomyces cavernae]|uniref:glycosyltransferase n=1 Tax=Streptomyces cavernae TaxID=2259034 RepID=UPI000FEC0130|nr:glycosyltransferase [Streptomyces cavernae]